MGARRVVATDLIADLVAQLGVNVSRNAMGVQAQILDWAVAQRKTIRESKQYDVVMFADGIYSERGAFLLADAVTSLVRGAGYIVGALPDLRAGVSSFERDLEIRGFVPETAALDASVLAAASRPHKEFNSTGLIAGGSVEGYRIIVWRYCEDGIGNDSTKRNRKRASKASKRKEAANREAGDIELPT